MQNFLVSSSPHITSSKTTKNIMLDVVIALLPAVIATFFLYGLYTILLVLVSVASCVLFEHLFCLCRKKQTTVKDLSAVVTGIILALNLPPVVPLYVPVVGGLFAIVIVKMLFGGLGKNFANPAITARIFLMLAWTSVMTQWAKPIDFTQSGELIKYFQYAFSMELPSAMTGATPLAGLHGALASGINPATGLNALDMFLGRIGGSAGEVSTLAILIGGIYLMARKVIKPTIPVLFIGSVAVFTAIFYAGSPFVGQYVWINLLGGGMMFGAFFMATDYASSPNTRFGTVVYAIGCGLLTVVFRKFSSMPEGVSYAILLMNIAGPLFDKIIPKPYGHPRRSFKDMIEDSKKKSEMKKQEKETKKAEKSAIKEA